MVANIQLKKGGEYTIKEGWRIYNCHSYPDRGRIGKVVASHAAVARSIPLRCTYLYYARGAQGVLPMRVGGATSQLDLPSLTPLSVAGCG